MMMHVVVAPAHGAANVADCESGCQRYTTGILVSMGQLAAPPFRFSVSELSGAVADLGVMLPLVLALVTLNGVDAVSAFTVIGAAYIIAAFTYRLPIPVQPLKSLAATALALKLDAPVITAGTYW